MTTKDNRSGGDPPQDLSSHRSFRVKVISVSLMVILALLVGARPENLNVVTQLALMTLVQIPLHELAHYWAAQFFFKVNRTAETKDEYENVSSIEQQFVKKYLAPRFGFNGFYGIPWLRIVPAIFLQELNYTGVQFARIALAGPLVDFSMAAGYITAGLLLGPTVFFGFFNSRLMLFYGVAICFAWLAAYLLKQLDLGQYRSSRTKRHAYNRFLMGAWYLDEAVTDEHGSLIMDNRQGHPCGQSRLRYLYEKIHTSPLAQVEFDLLLEAVFTANPPLGRTVRLGTLLEQFNGPQRLTVTEEHELARGISDIEKSLTVHGQVVTMDNPLYMAIELAALGLGVTPSTEEIHPHLNRVKKTTGCQAQLPYFIGGGKLIIFMDEHHFGPGGKRESPISKEFVGMMVFSGVTEERRAFSGRTTIQVGIAKMQALPGQDFSRELAHAEVLWKMISWS